MNLKTISAREICEFLGKIEGTEFSYDGKSEVSVTGFSSIKNYKENTITWIKKDELIPIGFDTSTITLAIVQQGVMLDNCNAIYHSHSKEAFFSILKHFFSDTVIKLDSNQCYVSPNSVIGNNVEIGYGSYIGDGVEIEDDVIIGHHVTIESRTHIGKGSRILSGVRIGSIGFGIFKDEEGVNHRVEHFGGVWIGEDVEIGNNTIVNRGTIDDTYIGNNVKIDSLKVIPHNVHIGDRCIILGSLEGSCIVGADSYIAPLAYLRNNVTVGERCMVNSGEILSENLPDGYVAHKGRKIKVDYKRIIEL